MDLDNHSPGNNKSRLSGTFSKVFRVQSASGVSSDNRTKKMRPNETTMKSNDNALKKSGVLSIEDEHGEVTSNEVFLSQLFASVSTVKAAYAQLQFAQFPYDPDGIHSADQTIVSELMKISKLKQGYLQRQTDVIPPGMSLPLSEIQEHKSLVKIYEITSKKLESQLRLKDSEISSLREKLTQAESDNKTLGKKVNASGQLVELDRIRLPDLQPSHFISCFRQTLKSIRSFVRLLIRKMDSAEWNLDDAAHAIEPGISFWKPSHKCYMFESYVCKKMFDGFNDPNLMKPAPNRDQFFETFMELKSVSTMDYLTQKPRSPFAAFCRASYTKLVHPKMEASLLGNLDIRDSVDSFNFPEVTFFSAFCEMAKRVWILHCLAFSFGPMVSIFQAGKGSRFCEVYMESLSDEAFLIGDGGGSSSSLEANPRVAFTVVPGFKIGSTVIQCQVYLIC